MAKGTWKQASKALGLAHRDIHSGARHDACNLALKAPTRMIFVPCEDGIRRNETENAKPEDLAAGANVLLMPCWRGRNTAPKVRLWVLATLRLGYGPLYP